MITGKRSLLRAGILTAASLVVGVAPATARAQSVNWDRLGVEAVKGAAIGYAVKQSAGPLNQFINAVTLRNGLADKQTTRVVPILSVGDKAYIGGAQVSGPTALIAKTQAVWQVEGSRGIGDGVYRVKALIPSDSLNPLRISRVPKVGVNAIIDVATGGPLNREGPYSLPVRGGDLIKAGAVAVAVRAAAKPLNDFVNTVMLNRASAASTRVVPMATFGEKAYIGAGQLSGAPANLAQAGAIWQYEDLFDRGRFRVKILVPTTWENPVHLRRVQGVGLTALIDAGIQRQSPTLARRNGGARVPAVVPARGRSEEPDDEQDDRGRGLPPGIAKKRGGWHDNGKHKGWYKKHGGDDDDRDRDENHGEQGRGKGEKD